MNTLRLMIWQDPTDREWRTCPYDGGEVRYYGKRRPGIRRLAREYGAYIELVDPDGKTPTWA